MKKILTLTVLLILVLFIAGCNEKENTQTNDTQTNNPAAGLTPTEQIENNEVENNAEESENIITGSLNKLIEMGTNVKCTFDATQEGVTLRQVTYVSGEKFFAETSMVQDNINEDFNTMSDGNWMYMWSDSENQGFKMNIEEMKDIAANYEDNEDVSFQSADLETEYDFKCSPWIPDNSKFVPPSNVEFVDLSEMFKGIADITGDDGEFDICAMCDMAPDEDAKTECLVNAGC